MSTRTQSQADMAPMESAADLAAYLATGCKPEDAFRIGTEHEKFAFRSKTFQPVDYFETGGIRDLLDGLTRFGWKGVVEDGNVIALSQNGASVSLEPGGQVELSGAPLESVHETCAEVHTHLKQVATIGDELGIDFLGLGYAPTWTHGDMPTMPKPRYGIMKEYMPKVGSMGLEMMFRTTTIQVNMDFSSEADMVKKLRVGLALQPVATALFANSPFKEGKPNGFRSLRSHIWTDTDNARAGMLPFVFEDGFGFEAYADYALDVPMYFIHRGGGYVNMAGQSFRAFLDGKLPGYEGEKPTLADWKDHLSTIFPEVRLKTFLEMRGADGGPWEAICGLPAFWVGLLYDQGALDAAYDLIKGWDFAQMQAMRDAVPVQGLDAPSPLGTLKDLSLKALELSHAGLKARGRLNRSGESEAIFLDDLWEIARSGTSPAQHLLDLYQGKWDGDLSLVFRDQRF
ncbi:MAG: glutamate--cysteine ligase [Pseudomonadota bacterium]